MKLYLIVRKPEFVDCDQIEAAVVAADHERQARDLAREHAEKRFGVEPGDWSRRGASSKTIGDAVRGIKRGVVHESIG